MISYNVENEIMEIGEHGFNISILDKLSEINYFFDEIAVLDFKIMHMNDRPGKTLFGEDDGRVTIEYMMEISFENFIKLLESELKKYPDKWFNVKVVFLKR